MAQKNPQAKSPLAPSASLLCKLGSIIAHVEEASGFGGHAFDVIALNQLMADPEVAEWMAAMRAMAFLPVKRKEIPWR